VQPVATTNWTNANVVRLDVTMRDTLFFEIVDNIQEVFAEALQQIDVQPPFFTESLTKRLLSGAMHQDTHAIADVEHIAVFDDMLMPRLLQDLALVFQTLIVFRIAYHLEDKFLAVTFDE